MPSETSLLNTTAWALERTALQVVDQVLSDHLSGTKQSIEAIEARLGMQLNNERAEKPYQLVDGVAVIELVGVMGKRMNMFTRISGGISTQFAQAAIEEALTDPAVDAVVLAVDSPGGAVDGTVDLGDFIMASRDIKPIHAYADGTMASGAYWIGSCCSRITAGRGAHVGSVSVVICHYDRSAADEKGGVSRTFITSGEYKRAAADNAPLDEKGRDYLQHQVDGYHAMFIETIADGRGMEPAAVQEQFGDGKMFIAAEAMERGMIDAIGTLAETIKAARAAAQEEREMTKAEILAKYPDAAAEIMEDGKQQALEALGVESIEGFEAQVNEQTDTTVAAEHARIGGLYGAVHGEEAAASFAGLISAGLTGEQVANLEQLGFGRQQGQEAAAGDDSKQKILAALANEKETELAQGKQAATGGDFMAAVNAYATEHKCGKVAAMKAVKKENPDLYEAYLGR